MQAEFFEKMQKSGNLAKFQGIFLRGAWGKYNELCTMYDVQCTNREVGAALGAWALIHPALGGVACRDVPTWLSPTVDSVPPHGTSPLRGKPLRGFVQAALPPLGGSTSQGVYPVRVAMCQKSVSKDYCQKLKKNLHDTKKA